MYSTTIFTTLTVALTTLCIVCSGEEHQKRIPSGFTGVRGKKSVSNLEYSPEDVTMSDLKTQNLVSDGVKKRAPSGFMGMRGKKPFSEFDDLYLEELYKRAPSGFMGMRGKKDMEFTNYDDYVKRMPSGFFGMRGKKEFDNTNNYLSYIEKKAPMGFVGMRGKKEFDKILEDKRAPSGFFGMRGKKMPRQSGFFGMRGKKYPYELRGKFVGVRGKKSSSENFLPLDQELDMNQLMLLLTENESENNNWIESDGVGQYSQK